MRTKLQTTLALCAVMLLPTSLVVTVGCSAGCGSLKPVPVAEGHDPVVVYAERAQTSSLKIYKEVTEWELGSRATLPPEVSRAIDGVRKEFPPAWRQSREALVLYKQSAGADPNAMDRVTGSLLVFQDTLLRLKKTANPNEASLLTGALGSLLESLKSLFGAGSVPQPQP